MTAAKRIWALTDDRPGNYSQIVGVAQAAGAPFEIIPLDYDGLIRLPNIVRGASLLGLAESARARLVPPWPDLAVGAGRRMAPIARWLKRQSGCRLVQVMDPGWPGRADFDLIAVPEHDQSVDAPNILKTLGAPHRGLPALTDADRARWTREIGNLPRPWLMVLVGGAGKNNPFDAETVRVLVDGVKALAAQCGASMLFTSSRRTGAETTEAIAALLPPDAYLYRWRPDGENPYLPLLAMADAVVATGDSMSMCSEACCNEGPVYIFAPPNLAQGKLALLHQRLYDAGLARPLGGDPTPWRHPPLNAATAVADAIRARNLL